MKSKLLSTIAHTLVLFGKCWRNSIVRQKFTTIKGIGCLHVVQWRTNQHTRVRYEVSMETTSYKTSSPQGTDVYSILTPI